MYRNELFPFKWNVLLRWPTWPVRTLNNIPRRRRRRRQDRETVAMVLEPPTNILFFIIVLFFLAFFETGNTPLPYKNPNKFVDQGYNEFNYSSPTPTPNVQTWKPSTPTASVGGRVVPIQMDGQISPFHMKLSDPLSQSPTVLQT